MKYKHVRFLVSILLSHPGILFFYSPALLILTVVGVAVPFATGGFIDVLGAHQSPWRPFTVLAALLLVKSLVTPALQRFICSRSRMLEAELQFRVLNTTMAFTPAQLGDMADGRIVAKLTRDCYAIGNFVRGLYPQLLQAVVMMVAAGCALFARSALLAIAFMVFFPLAILLFSPFARRFSANSHRVRQQSDRSINSLFDFLFSLPFLRVLGAEGSFDDAPKTALRELKDGNDETDGISVHFGFILALVIVVGEIAVLGVAGTLAAKGTIPVGDVVIYQMLFMTAIQSIQGVVGLLPEIATIREGADSLNEIFTLELPKPGSIRIDAFENLVFDQVTFAYADGHPVVRDFSANFEAGAVIGLSGMNGAGKSTLLKLAVKALEPQRGEIRVNGFRYDEIDLAAFRRRIGVVCQDNLLITGTIRDNITLRDPAFTQSDIDRALALSGFDAVVRRLPAALDTPVGNNLRTLSGGERQRLAIARAIIRNPLILILDEATNHLDAQSRRTLAELIPRLSPGRLILLAGHDPELDKICDTKISCQIF